MLAVLLRVLGLYLDIVISWLLFGFYLAVGSDPEDGQLSGVVVGLVNVHMIGRLRWSGGRLAFNRNA